MSLKLETFLTAWENLRPKHSRYYFTTHKGKKLFTSYIRKMVKDYGKKAGLDLHPHLLRHTYATMMLQRDDINIDNLKMLLGHKALSSTEVYLHTLPQDLHKKIRGKKDIEQKKEDLNNLFKQFLNKQNELADQVKKMLDKALEE